MVLRICGRGIDDILIVLKGKCDFYIRIDILKMSQCFATTAF